MSSNLITVSINPTYLCNFRCSFCYLTPSQLRDKTTLTMEDLDKQLSAISQYKPIGHIDLYGGEVGLLETAYFNELKSVVRKYYSGKINVVTNLFSVPQFLFDPEVDLSVSYDFDCRPHHEIVYDNIFSIRRPIHILVLATKELMRKDVGEMIAILNSFPNVRTVEIKPYSANQANIQYIMNLEFENFVKAWITSDVPKGFTLTNESNIRESITGQYNSFSNNHIYITPKGDLAVLEFDEMDREYFQVCSTIDEYIQWTIKEQAQLFSNSVCFPCEYMGRCLTEHMRGAQSTKMSCDGHIHLLNWYKHERMEAPAGNLSQD